MNNVLRKLFISDNDAVDSQSKTKLHRTIKLNYYIKIILMAYHRKFLAHSLILMVKNYNIVHVRGFFYSIS